MKENDNPLVQQFEQELHTTVLEGIQKLKQLQVEKKLFAGLDCDESLLNVRCLPLLNQAIVSNRTALRVKEYHDASTQACLLYTSDAADE